MSVLITLRFVWEEHIMASATLQLVILHEFVSILVRVGSVGYLPNASAKELSQKWFCVRKRAHMSIARKHAHIVLFLLCCMGLALLPFGSECWL